MEVLTNPACWTTNKAFSQLRKCFNERNLLLEVFDLFNPGIEKTAHRGAGEDGCLQTSGEFGVRHGEENLAWSIWQLINVTTSVPPVQLLPLCDFKWILMKAISKKTKTTTNIQMSQVVMEYKILYMWTAGTNVCKFIKLSYLINISPDIWRWM